MSQYGFAILDNVACITHVDNNWTEPIRTTLYWPVCCFSSYDREYYESLVGKEVIDGGSDGAFAVRIGSYNWHNLRLRDGGSTKPIHVDNAPIAPPKVRNGVDVRYRNGQWEKCLKSSGWVAA